MPVLPTVATTSAVAARWVSWNCFVGSEEISSAFQYSKKIDSWSLSWSSSSALAGFASVSTASRR